MYLFSAKMKLPVYYRLLGGNIVDVAAMALCVEEMGLSAVVYIAGKGFYSAGNAAMLEARNLRYIIPVRRDNRQIDHSPLEDGEFRAKHGRFVWQGRIIWYYGMSKTVYKLRIGGTWRLAEVTARVRKLLTKAGIDYLNGRN
jgi:hypothetical protein